MKKWIFGILIIILIAVVCVYVFIPKTLVVATVTPISTNYTSAVDYSSNSNNWKKWWPTINKNDSTQVGTYKGVVYQIVNKSYNNTQIKLVYKNDTTIANIAVAGFIHDSVKVICQFTFEAGLNPLTRIKQYNTAVYLKQNVHEVMDGLKAFLEKPENVYGFKITSTMVKDTVLMSTKTVFNHYPTTYEVYAMVAKLQAYIKQTGGIETNAPMLNVTKPDAITYKTMVAIPVNHTLPETRDIALKRMVIGKILESDSIKGGATTIDHSFKMFEQYFEDYKHTSPAIPFQLLLTDRLKEPDSTKWVTRFYYPIF